MFQKTLATVEPNIRVPFAAPIFNAAVISMASTSTLSQVSEKQNEPGRWLWEFDSDLSPEYGQLKFPQIHRI